VNGDGIDDFALANRDTSKVYVIYGRTTLDDTMTLDPQPIDATKGSVMTAATMTMFFGFRIVGGFDLNKDGKKDFVIEDHNAGASFNGKVYIVFGSSSNYGLTFNLDFTNPSIGLVITGLSSNQYFGHYCSGVKDINGDTFDDLLLANM
jgi:hypothetical protein